MLSVHLICVGKLKEKFYREAVEEYVKRLKGYCKLNLVELSEVKLPQEPSPAEIRSALDTPLVLHGGSGIPDDQIQAAIKNGIRKINFGTDVCFSFLDEVFASERNTYAIDLFMRDPVENVKKFALSKIKLLGSEGKA